jgi:hypothetical protein
MDGVLAAHGVGARRFASVSPAISCKIVSPDSPNEPLGVEATYGQGLAFAWLRSASGLTGTHSADEIVVSCRSCERDVRVFPRWCQVARVEGVRT